MANYLAQFQTIKSTCDRIVIAGTNLPASPLNCKILILARDLGSLVRLISLLCDLEGSERA
jgi:hypothetical protein